MRTFFNISPLFRQCHCHKQQIFFFHPIQIHSHIFFPSILAMALPQTMYLFFFFFLFTALQNKNIVLVLRIYILFFFCFCLHHFIIRILYLSLQRVNQNKNTVLEITFSVYQGTFTIIERDKLNCFGERLTICVLFFLYLSYILAMPLLQINCNKYFLFHPIQIHSHIYLF